MRSMKPVQQSVADKQAYDVGLSRGNLSLHVSRETTAYEGPLAGSVG